MNRPPADWAAVSMPITSPLLVDQGTARVAGLDRCVHLDEAADGLDVDAALVAGGDRLVERADVAGGHGGGGVASERVAQRDDRLSDGDRRRVADADGVEGASAVDLDERDVLGEVVADHVRVVGAPGAGQLDLDAGLAVDDVVVGEHLARRGDHHAGARGAAATAQGDVDVDDARSDLGRDSAGVGRRGRAGGATPGAVPGQVGGQKRRVGVGRGRSSRSAARRRRRRRCRPGRCRRARPRRRVGHARDVGGSGCQEVSPAKPHGIGGGGGGGGGTAPNGDCG